MARIELRGVTRRYGPHVALQPLDLEIRDGEFVTLLGPSGCGKTTTLRLIAGFAAPDGGEIRIDGAVLSSAGGAVPPERRHMGMVFQSYALWPHMSVFENVAFGLRVQKVKAASLRDRVGRVLEMVGLAGFDRRLPAALSGGQQQRVALARSLVTEPSILLLDEPLSNLDVALRERMRDEIKELHRRTGITFVYVTHDQAEAIALSDRIAVMESGRLCQYATPLELYEHPADRFVAGFLGAANLLDGVATAPGTVTLASGAALSVALPAGTEPGAAVTIMIRPEDVAITAAPGGPGVLTGTVEQSSLLGHAMEYRVRCADTVLRVHTRRGVRHEDGSSVSVTIPPEHCAIVPAGGSRGGP